MKITIQNNGIEITFEIKMMPDEGNMEYENKQISCSIISCDFAKNIAINSFYPSNKWFEKNGYCDIVCIEVKKTVKYFAKSIFMS